jgi:hypothetical protein
MKIEDLDRFNELAESCGNRYLAVTWVANCARNLGKQYADYHIPESKLLDWVITGHCPYTDSQLERRRQNQIDESIIESVLEWVTDADVESEVRRLYKKSVKSRKLITSENTNLSPGQQTRTGILLRMIWCSSQ